MEAGLRSRGEAQQLQQQEDRVRSLLVYIE